MGTAWVYTPEHRWLKWGARCVSGSRSSSQRLVTGREDAGEQAKGHVGKADLEGSQCREVVQASG